MRVGLRWLTDGEVLALAGVERLQIKWFAYAAAVFLTASIVLEYLYFGVITLILLFPIIPLMPVALGYCRDV